MPETSHALAGRPVILTGWNALMIEGLCAAYQAMGTPAHLAGFVHLSGQA